MNKFTGDTVIETGDQAAGAIERFNKKLAVYSMAGALAVGALVSGIAKGSSNREAASDLSGPQIQLVCAYPSDAESCDTNSVEQIGEQMQAYLGSQHPGGITGDGGAPGFSARLAMQGGNISVLPVQLDANSSAIDQMAADTLNNHSSSLYDYVRSQVLSKTDNSPTTEYATFITNSSGLENVNSCAPASNWDGMHQVNQNVVINYLDKPCTDISYPYLSSASLTKPAIFELAKTLHNDGYLHSCNTAFLPGGASNEAKNILNPDKYFLADWWQTSLGSWLKSTPSCPGADADPWMDWQVNTSTDGKGKFQFYIKNSSGSLTPTKLDPGSRLEAGQTYQAKYIPAKSEKLVGYGGDCASKKVCNFVVNQVVDIEANAAPITYNVEVKTSGVKVSGKGIHCPSDCRQTLPGGAVEKLTAKPNHKGSRVIWKNCGKVAGNVCTVIMNKNKTVVAAAK